MAKYTVHGGHAAHGKKYCGAVGYCSESLVDRDICKAVIKWLKKAGHDAYDCSVDSGLSQSNVISKIKNKINSYKNVTANISIHLNAATKSKADGKVKGTEVIVYSTCSNDAFIANRVCLEMKVLGFTNRGVKARKDLGILKGITNGGANILVECFFCDDQDDYNLFNKVGVDAIGKAIAMGVIGKAIPDYSSYIKDGIDYSKVFNHNYYAEKYADIKRVYGTNAEKLFQHFLNFGMSEGRQGCSEFNVSIYQASNPDLVNAFGRNIPAYYKHYCTYGYKENRKCK